MRVLESGKFLLLESGIQIKESRIGNQSPSSTNKDWNHLEFGIHGVGSRIQARAAVKWGDIW